MIKTVNCFQSLIKFGKTTSSRVNVQKFYIIFKNLTAAAAIILIFSLNHAVLIAQENVGIGTTSPDNTSILELRSTTQGFLVPRMSTAQRTAISSPADGLLIYNTDNDRFEYYNAGLTQWFGLIGAAGGITFDLITAGTNTNQALVIGANSSLDVTGNGRIVATEYNGTGSVTANVDLATSEVSGVLPIIKGGTNASTLTANGFLIYNGTSIVASGFDDNSFLDNSLTSGNIYVGNLANVATEVAMSGDVSINNAGVTTVNSVQDNAIETADLQPNSVDGSKINLTDNAYGDMMYYNGVDWVRLPAGTSGYLLQTNGAGFAPTWENLSGVPNGTIANATLRWDGSAWVENVQVKAESTGKITLGSGATAGSITINDAVGSQTATITTADLTGNRIFSLPASGADADFVVTQGNQSISGVKTFTNLLTTNSGIDVSNTSIAQSVKFYEGATNGTNYTSLQAPSNLSTNIPYILPTANGTDGQVLTLQTSATGQLAWTTSSGSGNTLDAAYDQGGDGVGRSITADAGAVEISNTALNNNAVLVLNNNNASANSFEVNTTGSDFIIDASGDVAIGNSTALGKLQVAGNYVHIGANASTPNLASGEGDLFVGSDLEVDGSFRMGANGSDLAQIMKTTVNADVGNIAASIGYLDFDFSVTNATIGSTVFVSPGEALPDNVAIGYAYVSSNGTVTVRFINNEYDSGADRNPTQMDYYITVIK